LIGCYGLTGSSRADLPTGNIAAWADQTTRRLMSIPGFRARTRRRPRG
jgi:hypothetical protein